LSSDTFCPFSDEPCPHGSVYKLIAGLVYKQTRGRFTLRNETSYEQ